VDFLDVRLGPGLDRPLYLWLVPAMVRASSLYRAGPSPSALRTSVTHLSLSVASS